MPEEQSIRDAEWRQNLKLVVAAARLLYAAPVPTMLRRISHADALGPVLAPSLWRDNAARMEQDRHLLRNALPLWEHAARLAEMAGADDE